jgi:hypothetical protein
MALLLSDEEPAGPALKDHEIRLATGMAPSTLERIRIRCCEGAPAWGCGAQDTGKTAP